MRLSMLRPSVRKARAVSGSPKSFSSRMSPPAQKAFSPAPARMMTRASSSASARSKALFNAFRTFVDTALTGGLLSVIVTTGPCFEYWTSESDTRGPLIDGDVGVLDHGAPQRRFALHPLRHFFDRAAGLHQALLEEL